MAQSSGNSDRPKQSRKVPPVSEKVSSWLNKAFCPLASPQEGGWVQYNKIFWDHIHVIFISVYCYNGSLLIIIVTLLLCLTYKWNFIIGMCAQEEAYSLPVGFSTIPGFRYPWGLGAQPLWRNGDYRMHGSSLLPKINGVEVAMQQVLNPRQNLLNLIVQLCVKEKTGGWASERSFLTCVNGWHHVRWF